MRIGERQLVRRRVAAQLLHRPRRLDPPDVVRHVLAVQAQIYPAARLALRARTTGITAADVDRARVDERTIVLTWAMRGTLHLVAADDYGSVVPLVVEGQVRTPYRRLKQMGVSPDRADRAVAAIERILDREGPLTRPEVESRLRRPRIPTEGQIMAHLMWLASAGGRICFGPDRAGEPSFVLVRDWLGEPTRMDREAALRELAVRYVASHGPAGPEDLASWSGVTRADARWAWGTIGDRVTEVETPTGTLWDLRSREADAPAGTVRLLPSFDEYLLGWKDRSFIAAGDRWRAINPGGGWYHPAVLVDGRAAGTWRAQRRDGRVRVSVDRFGQLPPRVDRAVQEEVADVVRFEGTA